MAVLLQSRGSTTGNNHEITHDRQCQHCYKHKHEYGTHATRDTTQNTSTARLEEEEEEARLRRLAPRQYRRATRYRCSMRVLGWLCSLGKYNIWTTGSEIFQGGMCWWSISRPSTGSISIQEDSRKVARTVATW